MQSKWKNLFVPVCVLTGEKDRIADTANFSFAKKNLINCAANCILLKNTGHLVTYEQSGLVRDLLISKGVN